MPVHELAALGAATCWALTGILAAGPAAELGALSFNRWRQIFALAMFAVVVAGAGSWRGLDASALSALVAVGLLRHLRRRLAALRDADPARAAADRHPLRPQRADRGADRLGGARRDARAADARGRRGDGGRRHPRHPVRQAAGAASPVGERARAAVARRGPRARRGDRAGARLDRRASGDGRGGRSVRRLAGAGRRRRGLPVGAGAAADRRGSAEGPADSAARAAGRRSSPSSGSGSG